jgi:two-component system sensor histidine kinase KdpD
MEGRQELLEVIDEEADRLNRFVEGLVEMARIEAGEMHLRRSWGAVEEIVASALSRAMTRTRQHVVETEIESELPAVRVDARAVAEVIYTLVDNAAKYSAPGTHICVSASRAPGEMIRLTIEDEGRGIPLEMRERVFDKFFRVTGEGGGHVRSANGIGMGLAIARGIVEAHGGRIWVEDRVEGKQGTRIAFTVPVGDEEEYQRNDKRGMVNDEFENIEG